MIQSAIALAGIAKQAAKGSAAAAPTFGYGVRGGSVAQISVEQELEDLTSAKRIAPSVTRTAVATGQDFTTRAFPGSLGLWLLGALGSVATTGAGPYVHTITPADDLPYMTLFGKLGASIFSVEDAKIDELVLSWTESQPLEVALTALGCGLGFPGTFTPGTDESRETFLTAASGTFKMDVDSDTPVVARIVGGEISIANALEAIRLSGSIVPEDVFPGRHEFGVTLTTRPTNLDDWRTVLTGSAAGTDPSEVTVYGSFEITFTLAGGEQLVITADRVAFTAEFPEAQPSGGAVELELTGMVVQPATGADPAITFELTNDVTSY